MRFFKEVNMGLTQGSQKKQIVGIILIVVFLLSVFVYGTRGYRASKEGCAFSCKKGSTEVETCQAENGKRPVKVPSVR
jgi:hypothetical protein